MALEKTITNAILRYAKANGWWCMKIAGGPYQMAGVPDVLCVRDGRAVFLEVKQPGKKPSALQVQRIKEIRETGGAIAEVVTSRDEAAAVLAGED